MVARTSSISNSDRIRATDAPATAIGRVQRFPWALVLAVAIVMGVEAGMRCVDLRKLIPYDLGLQEHYAMAAYMEAMGPPDVAILGSSRTREGVQAGQVRKLCQEQYGLSVRVANYAVSNARAVHYHTHVQALLRGPEKPRLILIGLSPQELYGGNDNWQRQAIFWNLSDWRRAWQENGWRMLNVLPIVAQNEIGRHFRALHYRARVGQVMRSWICGIEAAELPAEADISPFHRQSPTRSLVTDPVSKERVERYVRAVNGRRKTFVFSPLQREYLERTLQMCQDAGVPAVVFEIPTSQILQQAFPTGTHARFLALVEKLAARHHTPWVSVDDLGLCCGPEDFLEQSHLSYRGAIRFTEALTMKVIGPKLRGRTPSFLKIDSPNAHDKQITAHSRHS